ncbi:hypothetical protein SK3146_03091 [Paenibacillus konkukensis]|uniref:Glycosyltransferase 2-like domain-containing protein n=1 Tax=Paenibacillus konkukensis TaxID=2020716 RepID=A0ABY4RQA3_9BACL|nr:glycosyltransferase family 2 protein [Paenibacillus konkukensis]UQZ83884.1 hypothetical protein SK3146_03091 [Paenibacillus konkukensis]
MDNKPLTKLKSVAVVIPMYNEEIGIIENLTQITQMLRSYEKTLKVSFAFICVDDGSRDLTPSLVRDFCRHTYGCELISLTRNFGKEGAIEAGLVQANAADAIVVMDCDLQHPPELVESMVKLWQSGIDVVEAVKIDRGVETRSYKRMASLFYQLFGKLSGIDLKDRCDFKLLDAKVVRAYLNLNEKNRFFRGLIQWMGYPTAQIPFVVPERKGGGTRWSVFRLFRLSVTALTAFSSAPLQIVTVLGSSLSLSVLCLGFILWY